MKKSSLSRKDFKFPSQLPLSFWIHHVIQEPLIQRRVRFTKIARRNRVFFERLKALVHVIVGTDIILFDKHGTIDDGKGIIDGIPCSALLFLLRALENGEWETLVRPGKRAKVGASFSFGGILRATVTGLVDGGNRTVKFEYDTEKYKNIYEALDEIGNMPLPPYITKKLENKSDYQTVYAKEEGSAAAPTAGLHFTDELIDRIKAKGVGYGEVTLHVGLGTFRPVKVDKIEEHLMHGEYFHITDEVAAEINRRRAAGGRIIAVGTTSSRVLESVSTSDGLVHPIDGETSIFIYPGYKFKAVDALITNFHLPESTLIM